MTQRVAPRRWRALSTCAAAAVLAGVCARGLAAAPLAEPPCSASEPVDLAFTVRAQPTEVAVGESVDLEAQITARGDAHAAIPLFRLIGADPGFSVEAQDSSYPALTYARYRLRAVQPGETSVQVAVNFATAVGCGEAARLVFRTASSELIPIRVREVAGAPSATTAPTGTAIPASTARPAEQRRTPLKPGRTSGA